MWLRSFAHVLRAISIKNFWFDKSPQLCAFLHINQNFSCELSTRLNRKVNGKRNLFHSMIISDVVDVTWLYPSVTRSSPALPTMKSECNIYDFYASTLSSRILLIINAVTQCDKTITFRKATIKHWLFFHNSKYLLLMIKNSTSLFMLVSFGFGSSRATFFISQPRDRQRERESKKTLRIISFSVASSGLTTFNLGEGRWVSSCNSQ